MKNVVSYLCEREVEHLVHFTPLSNLERIKREGIRPRCELEKSGDESFVALDEKRIDRRKEASCFSISFPNYGMMCRYRNELKEAGSDVALLFIPIAQLEEFSLDQVMFHSTNAASTSSLQKGVEELRGVSAVRSMFVDEVRTRSGNVFSRADEKLPPYLTTDPQAEVQIASVVPWSSVAFVVVDGPERKRELKEAGVHPNVYAKWCVKREDDLNVFRFPGVWRLWGKSVDGATGGS